MTTASLIPAEEGLANRWRTWRRILYTFYKQRGPVRILEIGAYRGEATAWFLRNLCGHAESRVYAVDTFEGSAEYTDTNFSKIEQAFQASIRATGRQARVTTMKMLSYHALLQLNQQFNRQPCFDVVLVIRATAHTTVDVPELSERIRFLWEVLHRQRPSELYPTHCCAGLPATPVL